VSDAIGVLLVVDSLEVGGAERHVVDLAVALSRRGHGVAVACSAAGELLAPLEEEKVPHRVLLGRLVKRRVSLAYARGLRRLVKERRFDLVHTHIYASAASSALSTLGIGVPLVVTEHTEGAWQGRLAHLISRLKVQRGKAEKRIRLRCAAIASPCKPLNA